MEDIKEKTADEMFKELEYEKVKDNDFNIKYGKTIDGDLFQINFFKDDKTISKNHFRDVGYITMQELQAINKKCKELRLVRR